MNKMADKDTEAMLERLHEGKVVQIIPQGISMLPFITGGEDKVLLRKEAQVNVGDIVLVCFNDKLILHRVYAINGTQLTLMGDGNLQGTEQVGLNDVLGTVAKIIKPDGRCRKPNKAWSWRHLLPIRRYLLKMYRKWNRIKRQKNK